MDQDSVLELAEVLERSLEEPPIKRRLAWIKENSTRSRETAAPSGTFRERKRPQRFASYVVEPSLFDEANKLQDAMLDEYKSIMKNSVWACSQAQRQVKCLIQMVV
jgi:hypothetical protein